MEQYIPKSALVAEINQRVEDYKSHKIDDSYHDGLIFALEDLRDDFINTLEVKEINTEGVVKSLFENNDRIYDEYGNYYYKNSENDYRFYHKIDEDNWDEDRLSLSEVAERLFSVNSIKVKEVDLENYNKVKKLLSLSFMHFLDNNRQEGKMCLSNGECFDIDKAFDELDFAKLLRYAEKYLKKKGEKV